MKEKYQIKCPYCGEAIYLTVAQEYERSAFAKEIEKQTKGLRDVVIRLRKENKELKSKLGE